MFELTKNLNITNEHQNILLSQTTQKISLIIQSSLSLTNGYRNFKWNTPIFLDSWYGRSIMDLALYSILEQFDQPEKRWRNEILAISTVQQKITAK